VPTGLNQKGATRTKVQVQPAPKPPQGKGVRVKARDPKPRVPQEHRKKRKHQTKPPTGSLDHRGMVCTGKVLPATGKLEKKMKRFGERGPGGNSDSLPPRTCRNSIQQHRRKIDPSRVPPGGAGNTEARRTVGFQGPGSPRAFVRRRNSRRKGKGEGREKTQPPGGYTGRGSHVTRGGRPWRDKEGGGQKGRGNVPKKGGRKRCI